jgi:hypothetical protein
MHEGHDVLAHPRSELRGLAASTSKDNRALAKLLLAPPEHENVLRGELSVRQKVAWNVGISLE